MQNESYHKRYNSKAMGSIMINILSMCYNILDESANSVIPLFDITEKRIFAKIDYSVLSSIITLWMMDAGCSAESTWSKNQFNKYINNTKSKTLNRILYYHDVSHLISSLQDRFNMAKGKRCT